LYYVVNVTATILVSYWLKELGGTSVDIEGPEAKVGTARRMGSVLGSVDPEVYVIGSDSDGPAYNVDPSLAAAADAEGALEVDLMDVVMKMQPSRRVRRPSSVHREGARAEDEKGSVNLAGEN